MIASSKGQPTKFVKRTEKIPKIPIPGKNSHQMALSMAEHGFIGQFIDMWPSLGEMVVWIQWNWQVHLKGKLTHFFCGHKYYTFMFQTTEDKV
jgi:hypothetical protein